ncbi:hypothetical protein [Geobacter sp. AOG1]|uniref:hypothetical protein n=1 Tax=Geobacter sp. AOG1 TaxID=1566346 RepID=UPI001CC754A6|nr:hypothetical protein [Geobacter sp. AOG1]GFE56406.1 hypothetical protein AOG1_02850 [Geobacter sp. AOG1]
MADTSSIWQSNNTAFSELKGEALAALNRLESAARAQVYNKVEYKDPGDIHTPGHYEPIDINSLPTVDEVMSKVNSIKPDMFPEAPRADDLAKYKKHVWESTQLDTIQATLMSYISSMGMPSQEFQDSIFNEDKERRQKALNDSIDLIKAQTSARGFKYATGQTNALIADLIQKDQFDRENLNREIDKLMTQWATTNLQFALQQGASVEVAHMDFAHKYAITFRELYMTQLNGILEKFRIQVQQELSKLDAVVRIVGARADVLNANAGIVGKEDAAWHEKNRLEITEALGRYSTAVQAMLGQGTIEINASAKFAEVATGLAQSVTNSVLGLSSK